MIDITSKLNSALFLLRQGGNAALETEVPKAPDTASRDLFKAPAAAAQTEGPEYEVKVIDNYAKHLASKVPGMFIFDLAKLSRFQKLSHEETETFRSQKICGYEDMDHKLSGEQFHACIWGNAEFQGIVEHINGLNAFGDNAIYRSHPVEPDPAATPVDAWDKQIRDAEKRTSILVGTVIEANSKFHELKPLDLNRTDIDEDVSSLLQVYFESERSYGLSVAYNAESDVEFARSSSRIINTMKTETGEYRITPYKIMSSDEKQVVAEMRDDGHFITYNKDGTVRKERNRFEVCAELSDGYTGRMAFGRFSTLTYNQDKDLMFY